MTGHPDTEPAATAAAATGPAESTRTDVIVGFDGSPDAARALRWAARLAERRGCTLRVVVARGDLHSLSAWADEWTRGLATEWLEQAQKLLTDAGGPPAELEVADGLPAAVMVEASTRAGVVVIGSGGHSRIGGIVQGSVSQHVARHASCPVVVVRPRYDEASREVYVGVDGSVASLAAMDFAAGYAADLGGLRVTAVVCFEPFLGIADEHYDELATGLAAELDRALADIRGKVRAVADRHPGTEVVIQESSERATRALTDAAQHADLVVVGSRGRGAFAGMLLGSVSATVMREARCPVAVVRTGETGAVT